MSLAPDPASIRRSTVKVLGRLGIPAPPPGHPLVWEPGDLVELRPIEDIEARAAVLNVVLAAVFGLPRPDAMRWLLRARLLEHVSKQEWHLIASGTGDPRQFALRLDAMYALAWVLGMVDELDPELNVPDGLPALFPDVSHNQSYGLWRSRMLPASRTAAEVAAALDLYYCVDWAYRDAIRAGRRPPGAVQPFVVSQRRWALEWAVVFTGPYHEPPPDWDDIDVSS